MLKRISKCSDSNTYLALQNFIVIPTVPWAPLEFLTLQKCIKIYDMREIRTRIYCLKNFCPNVTAETIHFTNKKKLVKIH